MGAMSLFKLDGKRALITGGSRGLGKEMALALAEAGADIVIVGRDESILKNTAKEIGALGHEVGTIQADISTPEEATKMAEKALSEYGRIDILINNVGGRRMDIPTEELPYDKWKWVLDLNLTSCFLCCKIIGKEMVKRKKGKVINTASISGIISNKGIYGRSYETAKAAVMAFTKALAADWAPYNINVNAIAPGYFLTDVNKRWFNEKPGYKESVNVQIPMGRPGDPKEIGPLAVYLASEASSYMTGSVIVIDGGVTLW